MAKSRAAVELGRRRWKGKSKAERTAHARMMARRLWDSSEAHERMRQAARSRWARYRAAKSESAPEVEETPPAPQAILGSRRNRSQE